MNGSKNNFVINRFSSSHFHSQNGAKHHTVHSVAKNNYLNKTFINTTIALLDDDGNILFDNDGNVIYDNT